MSKKWYHSKTVWVNATAAAAVIFQAFTGFVVDPAAQAAIIVIANLVLRFITSEGLE